MVSYIVDENGNKTHAVVPINEWIRITNMTVEETALSSVLKFSEALKGKVIASTMYDITSIVSELDTDEDINSILRKHYKYFEAFDSKDIGLLYLMRTSDFNTFMLLDFSMESAKKSLNELNKLFNIRNLQNQELTLEEFKKLQQIFILSITPQEAINKFNKDFQIGVQGFSKRIRKDAEIKRLFFYDFTVVFPIIFSGEINGFGDVKEIMESISEKIYLKNSKESAVAQMNKAIRDAKDRIFKGQWKMYIGE